MIRYAILLISTSLVLFGCTRQNPQALHQAAPAPHQHTAQTQKVHQTEPRPAYNQSPQAKAERLSQLASRVKKVKGATAVVAGNWAVVGINVDPHLARHEVGVIKYSVAEALKADPQGANAVVTADPAIVQRLREMAAESKKGRPISGIANELSKIVGRIMPQLPQNVQKREQPPSRVNQQNINKPGKPQPAGNTKLPVQR